MNALMATVRKQMQAAVANLMKARKDKAPGGGVQRTLTKNFGGILQASNRSNSVDAEDGEVLLDCSALTKAQRRTISTIAKQMRRRGHKSQLSGQTASRYTTVVRDEDGTEELATEPAVET